MNTSSTRRVAALVLIALLGCEQPPDAPKPPESPKAPEAKRVPMGKGVTLEIAPNGGPRRVRVEAEVCMREGPPLEVFLCRRDTKEHEAVLAGAFDARDIHKALLAAGAKIGTPLKYDMKVEPPKVILPTGTRIKVAIEYAKDGKTVTEPAQSWVREVKSKKPLTSDWVFVGSAFFADPENPKKPPMYAANSGEVIVLSNFESAMLDLPINSSKNSDDLQFEAHTDRVPPLQTKVVVILEVVEEKPVKQP